MADKRTSIYIKLTIKYAEKEGQNNFGLDILTSTISN